MFPTQGLCSYLIKFNVSLNLSTEEIAGWQELTVQIT